MGFKIVEYSRERDAEFLKLFYESIFYDKKEFDYVRVPNEWILRYKMSGDYVVRGIERDDKIIASLGVILLDALVKGESVRIASFVDNCIHPHYRKNYNRIFELLFSDISAELRCQDVSILCGWEFEENFLRNQELFKRLGFKWIKGVNWFSSGINLKGTIPYFWRAEANLYWRLIFKLLRGYNKAKSLFVGRLPENIHLRSMEKSDYSDIVRLLENTNKDFEIAANYTLSKFGKIIKNNNIQGIVAEKDSEIIGVLTYIISAWSGWMFGKPVYSDNWQIFYGYTPDEFAVVGEFQNSTVPANMLLYIIDSKPNYSFVASVFDRRIKWRRNAFSKLGFMEPTFDKGVLLAKSLDNDIKLDGEKPWHLPARCILAPVAYSEELGEDIG